MRILILTLCLLGVIEENAWAETQTLSNNKIIGHCSYNSQVKVGDREVVLQTIATESASQPEGMPYVAMTLYNRALKRGTSMSEEALRARQYSCWNSQKWAKTWLSRHYGASVQLQARLALAKGLEMRKKGIGEGITHYHTVNTSPYWAKGHTPALILGGHRWYRGIK